jgi:predicted O-methyltransferase YrrM
MTDDELMVLCGPIAGWMYPDELIWLHRQAANRHTVVELGVWQGRATMALATATPGRVYGVDHWHGSPNERATHHRAVVTATGRAGVMAAARHNLAPYIAAGRCVLVEAEANVAAARFAVHPIDMLFIDATHTYEGVRGNLEAYMPYLAYQALVCGHDLKAEFPGVGRAVESMFGGRMRRGPGSIWYVEL